MTQKQSGGKQNTQAFYNIWTTCMFHSYKYTVSNNGSDLQAGDLIMCFPLEAEHHTACPVIRTKCLLLGKLLYLNMLCRDNMPLVVFKYGHQET